VSASLHRSSRIELFSQELPGLRLNGDGGGVGGEGPHQTLGCLRVPSGWGERIPTSNLGVSAGSQRLGRTDSQEEEVAAEGHLRQMAARAERLRAVVCSTGPRGGPGRGAEEAKGGGRGGKEEQGRSLGRRGSRLPRAAAAAGRPWLAWPPALRSPCGWARTT
jgi:hypothetical protein